MGLKYTTQGILIYAAMLAYIAAFTTALAGRRKAGKVLYILGFLIAFFSFAYRWYDVRHVPLQNLFEVFLCMGVVILPVSLFCERMLGVGGRCADMAIGAIVLFPAGFVFSGRPQQLPPALQSWLFGPHVAVYTVSYLFMAKACFQAICELTGKSGDSEIDFLPAEEATYRMVRVGFPLLTVGLVLGSCWGKLAWGDYWGWDPKELWSLASWLVYVGYLHFRYMFGKKHPRMNSIWAVVGMAVIVVTLLWVNLSKLFSGLHSYAT